MTEQLIPQFDWILLKKIEHEEVSPGGIILARPGDHTDLKTDRERHEHRAESENNANERSRDTNRFEVLACGPGAYTDVMDEVHSNTFLRKPVCCEDGDIVIVQEGAFPIAVNGEYLYLAHDYNILARLHHAGTKGETVEPLNDYIFSREVDNTQKRGSIIMPGATDQTGNRAMPKRFEALGVGDGPWCLKSEKGKPAEFVRRPMSVKTGDKFAFEGNGFYVHIGGAPMICTQSYQTSAIFRGL